MEALEKLGKYSLLLYRSLRSLAEVNTYKKNLVDELLKIGYESVAIVLLTGYRRSKFRLLTSLI